MQGSRRMAACKFCVLIRMRLTFRNAAGSKTVGDGPWAWISSIVNSLKTRYNLSARLFSRKMEAGGSFRRLLRTWAGSIPAGFNTTRQAPVATYSDSQIYFEFIYIYRKDRKIISF